MCTNSYNGVNCENKIDPCLAFECFNGGTCTTLGETTFCKCTQGFGGPKCEFLIGCQVTCQNGGVCNANGTACNCPADYGGIDCTTTLNACLSNPCQNGGVCVNNQTVNGVLVSNYVCSCPDTHTGVNCETKQTVI